MWGAEGGHFTDVRRNLGQIDFNYRQRELFLDPQRLQSLLHSVRLALHRIDEHARNVLPSAAPNLEGIFRAGALVVVAHRMRRWKHLVAGASGGLQHCAASDRYRAFFYELAEIIESDVLTHAFSRKDLIRSQQNWQCLFVSPNSSGTIMQLRLPHRRDTSLLRRCGLSRFFRHKIR